MISSVEGENLISIVEVGRFERTPNTTKTAVRMVVCLLGMCLNEAALLLIRVLFFSLARPPKLLLAPASQPFNEASFYRSKLQSAPIEAVGQ